MSHSSSYTIGNMHCASCAVNIEKELADVPGVLSARVNAVTETALIESEQPLAIETLQEATGRAGDYVIAPSGGSTTDHSSHMGDRAHQGGDGEHDHAPAAGSSAYRNTLVAVVGALFVLAALIAFQFWIDVPYEGWIALLLATPVQFVVGATFYKGMWGPLKRGRANMDTLIALGSTTAYAYSLVSLLIHSEPELFLDASVAIVSLVALGRLLESRAKGRASAALQELSRLQPQVAHLVLEGGDLRDVSVSELKVGDRVRVKASEQVPVDGVVVEGSSSVDESLITGESLPVQKEIGASVIGGTLNQRGTFVLRAEGLGLNSVLSQMTRMVEEAQMSKAPIQKLADAISAVFVPVLLLIAIGTFLVWWLGGFADVSGAVLVLVSVLVVACPCALGLATPTAVITGVGNAARRGILVRDAETLQHARNTSVMVFDKTGTITQGSPTVTQVLGDATQVLSVAAALESASEHPLASAVLNYAQKQGATTSTVEAFEAVTGQGVQGVMDGEGVAIGSLRFMKERSVTVPAEIEEQAQVLEAAAQTVVFVSRGEALLGALAITDPVKETSAEAIQVLKRMGIRSVLLTGDAEATARAVASEVGIETYTADMRPEEKLTAISRLQQEGEVVAMVGDGVNDAPALAQANVGIAMGTGTDSAREAAGMTLIQGDLLKATEAIQLSRATMRLIKQNLGWAFIYNLVLIPVAAFGLLHPAYAAGAMALSSISVVLNSLRVRR